MSRTRNNGEEDDDGVAEGLAPAAPQRRHLRQVGDRQVDGERAQRDAHVRHHQHGARHCNYPTQLCENRTKSHGLAWHASKSNAPINCEGETAHEAEGSRQNLGVLIVTLGTIPTLHAWVAVHPVAHDGPSERDGEPARQSVDRREAQGVG